MDHAVAICPSLGICVGGLGGITVGGVIARSIIDQILIHELLEIVVEGARAPTGERQSRM
jgi:hypothetical protein